jgi:hypothetical protein
MQASERTSPPAQVTTNINRRTDNQTSRNALPTCQQKLQAITQETCNKKAKQKINPVTGASRVDTYPPDRRVVKHKLIPGWIIDSRLARIARLHIARRHLLVWRFPVAFSGGGASCERVAST